MTAAKVTRPATALRSKALAFAAIAADKQFAGRKGHGGNPALAERHLTRQQLTVLMAAAFEAGANMAYPALVAALRASVEWDAMMRERFKDRYPLDLRPTPNVRAVDARALLAKLGEGV